MAHQLESIDLGFVNYTQHPENEDYYVFRFSDIHRANDFRKELDLAKIWFEESLGEKRSKTIYLFGIHRSDFDKAQKINFKVEGHHKKPIIPFKGLRWFVILFGMSAVTLATIGYCKKQSEVNQTIQHFETKE
jgi:hypothetical protein